MSSGVISEHGSIVLQLKPHQIFTTTKKKPLMETSHFFLPINTHFPKSNLLIENRISDSGYSKFSRFRTKATSNNGSVMAAETDELSFYQLLGISESGSFSEIKQAYKQLARKYHPDVSPPDRTEENTKRFILVQEAYETLSDPTRRAMYDRDLARGLHLAFSASKRYYHPHGHHNQEGLDEKTEWKNRWQTQLSGLKMKSKNRDSNMSWAALMRKQRNKESSEV